MGDGLVLDMDAVVHILVQGTSGAGKTGTIRRILEAAAGLGFQLFIIDPEGEYATLRDAVPDLVIAGGLDADVPLTTQNAGQLAEQLYKLRAHAVFDVSEHDAETEGALIVAAIHTAVNRAPRTEWHDLLMADDELQQFSSKDKSLETKQMVKARKAIGLTASAGRKRGHHLLAGTQRVAALDNSVVSLCNAKLIGRSDADTDQARTVSQLGLTGDEKKAALERLDDLRAGQFYARGIAFNHKGVRLVQIARAKTESPGRGAGRRAAQPPRGTVLDVLRTLALTEVEPEPDGAPVPKRPPADPSAEVRRLQGLLEAERERFKAADAEASKLSAWVDAAEEAKERLRAVLREIQQLADRALDMPAPVPPPVDGPRRVAPKPTPHPSETVAPKPHAPTGESVAPNLAPSSRPDVVSAIADLEGIGVTPTARVVATWAGIAPRTLSNKLQALRREGLVGRGLELTPKGRASVTPNPPPNWAEALTWLRPRVGDRVLEVLIEVRRVGTITPSALAERLGIAPRTMSNRLQDVGRAGVIRRAGGRIELAEWLRRLE